MTTRCFRQRESRWEGAASLRRRGWNESTGVAQDPSGQSFGALSCRRVSYFHPHSLRKSLVRLGQEVCQSPEQFKAWSQNLGHEQVLTTFLNYGSVARERQGEIIRGLGAHRQSTQSDAEQIAEAVVSKLRCAGTATQAKDV